MCTQYRSFPNTIPRVYYFFGSILEEKIELQTVYPGTLFGSVASLTKCNALHRLCMISNFCLLISTAGITPE